MKADQDDTNAIDDAEQDSKWGFKSGRSGMATETKIGLLLILVLVGAFGFVVYKKMDKHHVDRGRSVKNDDDSNENFKLDGEAPPPRDGGHKGHKHNEKQHAAVAKGNFDANRPAPPPRQIEPDPFGAAKPGEVFVKDTNVKPVKDAPKPVAPPPPTEEFNPFAESDAAPKKPVTKAQNVSQQADPFGSPVGTDWAADQKGAKDGMQIRPDQNKPGAKKIAAADENFDPLSPNPQPAGKTFADDSDFNDRDMAAFDANINRGNQRVEELPQPGAPHGRGGHKPIHKQPAGDLNGDPNWDDGGRQVVGQRGKSGKGPKKEVPVRGEFAKSGKFDADDFGGAGSFKEAPSPRGLAPHEHHGDPGIAGFQGEPPEVYVVESGDNYWRISKKQYGTARYFTALARFNEQRIPDPKAMRPGMKVLIPTEEQLHHCFPHLLPHDSQITQVSGTSDDVCHPEALPGFFIDGSGEPMYRVGASDTLTEIAKHHLGRSSRWIQVFKLNSDRLASPNSLKIGMELRLPADASQVELVNEPVEIR
jgi:nucleoid-associated protein YgaU